MHMANFRNWEKVSLRDLTRDNGKEDPVFPNQLPYMGGYLPDVLAQRGTTDNTRVWLPDPDPARAREGWEYIINSDGNRTFRQRDIANKSVRYTNMGNRNTSTSWNRGHATYVSGTEWCQETKDYRDSKQLVKIKGQGARLLRAGRGRFLFCLYPYRGMTRVRIYDKRDKRHLSTRDFDGEITPQQAKVLLFNNSSSLSVIKKKAVRKPFRAIYRHIILPKQEFDKKYTPNAAGTTHTNGYSAHKKENKVQRSLASIIGDADGDEFRCGTPSSVLEKCHKRFREERADYDGEYPCVEVFAVWLNFDPETQIVHKEYDSWEPNHYSYHVFNSKNEMENYPL